jgi:phospholipid/cholesterol/gamma-HCH transport system ATP-binding protein
VTGCISNNVPMNQAVIAVDNLTMSYGDVIIQTHLNFRVERGDIFMVMGPSGCGKSTLLMHMIGLIKPTEGEVYYGEDALFASGLSDSDRLVRRIGVLFQSGALLSSMTLAENISLPLAEFTDFSPRQIRQMASYKLSLVGLAGFEDYYPAEISGGMQKRAGLARAMALDPEILYFDEPSAGLDPISSKLLDDLIQSLRDNLGTTIIVVTHELSSIFSIGTNSIFLDTDSHSAIAMGPPRELLKSCEDVRVRRFLTRDGLSGAMGHE